MKAFDFRGHQGGINSHVTENKHPAKGCLSKGANVNLPEESKHQLLHWSSTAFLQKSQKKQWDSPKDLDIKGK